jgi:pseudaminic acid cytidylyltransferase
LRFCIIPARGGSKRIPRKNLKYFRGKPIIQWSIDAAHEANCFEKIVVSTDDEQIAEYAIDCGAHVPFLRPKELSDDFTSTGDVVRHAIKLLATLPADEHCKVCCLYATAPFVRSIDLINSLSLLDDKLCDFVLPVTKFSFPIHRALEIERENGLLSMNKPQQFMMRSQDLNEYYHDAGQFCWGTLKSWCETNNPFERRVRPFILPSYRVQDIDTLDDWRRAEFLHAAIHD